MNLSSAEAYLHGSVDKWASITRVFYSLIKIYHRPNIFSIASALSPPPILSFLFADRRIPRHQPALYDARARDIDTIFEN